MGTEKLEAILVVGAKIKLGKKCCEHCFKSGPHKPGDIIELIKGYFDHENGLWCETVHAPSIWNEKLREFDSIYHLFENDLSGFLDSEVIN